MFKRGLFTALAAAAVLCMAVPAAAETFTASNGILSIDLPNENWKEITDPQKWIALSDGANLITVEHVSNGETLPDITVADEHYVDVYEAAFSTQNEVFIVTGSVVDAAKIPEICNAIMSVKVLQYDTKQAVKKDTTSVSEFSVVPMNTTMKATSGVYVRQGCSTDSAIIGALAEGDTVRVVGKVQRNGQDLGWYQISFGSGTGYVSASFLKEDASSATNATATPTPTPAPTQGGRQYTGSVRTIYDSDGEAVTVYQATDGNWYDTFGVRYTDLDGYTFSSEDGFKYTTNRPQTSSSANQPTGSAITVYWGNSNTTTLTPYSDGYYYSAEWVRYSNNGDGTYTGADGTTLYSYDPIGAYMNGGDSNSDIVENATNTDYVESDGSGRPVTLYFEGGAWQDEEGNEYYDQGDGTYIDDYGATYR